MGEEKKLLSLFKLNLFLDLRQTLKKVMNALQSDALERMQRLLVYCDTALRHFGVRSARLRRTEIDTNNSETWV